eukprot:jgi/Orpsp1_1/1182995/evm.model.c7180000083420.1
MNTNNQSFEHILNDSILHSTRKEKLSLLSLICANQLGIVIEFMIKRIKLYDIVNSQDDDGNTPIHLLCKNVDNLEQYNVRYGDTFDNILYTNCGEHSLKYSDFSSRPQLKKCLEMIDNLSIYADLSIKNKDGKTPDELTNNILVQNSYCFNLINKKKEKQMSFNYGFFTDESVVDWKKFFTLKDSKRKNKTLMHFLCDGDRLGAIQFIVEHGANINGKCNEKKYFIKIFGGMKVGGCTPFNFLFSTFNREHYAPSGIYYKDNFDYNLLLNNPKKFIETLNKSEQYILNETENIIKYFVSQGVDLSLEENPCFRFCGISNIMYKLLKPKKKDNISENSRKNESIPVVEPSSLVVDQTKKTEASTSINPSENDKSQNINKNDDASSNSLNNINPVKAHLNLPVSLWEDLRDNNQNFKNILNSSIINNHDLNFLSLICANQIGIVIEFIIKNIKLIDIINCQDEDGNTPMHLLCRNVNNLEQYNIDNDCLFYEEKDHSKTYNDFSSRSQLKKCLEIIDDLSCYADFSIKNKDGKTPDEMTNDVSVQNIYCFNLINREKQEKSKMQNNSTIFYRSVDEISLNSWKSFLSVKDSTRKNKTLMHFLCDGDRLGAIQFLVEHGADINNVLKSSFSISMFGGMIARGRVPFNFLFSSSKEDYYAPSGFYNKKDINYELLLNSPKKFIETLNKSEQYILYETENIIKYFVGQGIDLTLEENPSFRYCRISNILYRLLKNSNHKNNGNVCESSIEREVLFDSPSESKREEDNNQIINESKPLIEKIPISIDQDKSGKTSTLINSSEEEVQSQYINKKNNDNKYSFNNRRSPTEINVQDINKNDNNISINNINPVKAHLNLPVCLWEDLRELSILTDILNIPIIKNDPFNKIYDLLILSLICANQLGIIIEFIIESIELTDILNSQDDDGNTPMHLLCKNVDNLEQNNVYCKVSGLLYRNNFGDHSPKYSNFSSRPQLQVCLNMIQYLTSYTDFSIKNKEGKTPDELTNDVSVQNIFCLYTLNKNRKINKLYNNNLMFNNFNQTLKEQWKSFLSLKDSKRKNKTLMHFLCDGDRLGAIQFLVEHGANINKVIETKGSSIKIFGGMCVKGCIPFNYLFSTFNGEQYAPSGFYHKTDFKKGKISNSNSSNMIINKDSNRINGNKSLIKKTKTEIASTSINLTEEIQSESTDKNNNETNLSNDIKPYINKNNNDDISLNTTNPVKAHLNLPVYFWEDLKELSILTGKSVDTLCWETFTPILQEKLKTARGFNEEKKNNSSNVVLKTSNENSNIVTLPQTVKVINTIYKSNCIKLEFNRKIIDFTNISKENLYAYEGNRVIYIKTLDGNKIEIGCVYKSTVDTMALTGPCMYYNHYIDEKRPLSYNAKLIYNDGIHSYNLLNITYSLHSSYTCIRDNCCLEIVK